MRGPGKLVVPVIATTAGFAKGLAQSSRMADAWADKIGGRLDKAFAGVAKPGGMLGGLTAGIQRLGRATGIARTTVAVADVGRAAGWSKVGVDRLRMAFTFNAKEAEHLRSRSAKLAAGLRLAGDASEKARLGLLAADIAGFAGKAAVVVSRTLPGLASGIIRTAGGFARMASGIGLAIGGVVMFVPNVTRMTKALWSAVAIQRGAADRAREFGRALIYGFRAAGPIRGVAGLLSGVVRAGRGLAGVGLSLVKLPFQAAAAGVGLLARGLGGAVSSALSVAAGLAKVAAVAGVLAGVLGVKAAASAAHLEETYNKTRQTFGDYSSEVLKAAKVMEDAYGVQPQPFLDGAVAVGSMLKGMGYAQGDAAKLGTNLAKLAADSKAFRDVGLDVALQKIRSGLSGESEPLKEFGILIDEGALKSYGLANGMIKVGEEMSQAQKVQARLALITQGLKDDMGALAREADGPAAQISEFSGRLQTLMDSIGATLAPILGAALKQINTAIVAMTIAWEDSRDAVLGWFGLTNESLEGAAGGVGVLQTAIGWIADAWGLVKGATAGVFSYMEAGLSKVSGWIATVFEALGQLPGAGDWTRNTAAFLREYSESAKVVSEDLWKATEDAFSGKALGSKTVDDYFRRAGERIAKAREEASKALDFKTDAPADAGSPKQEKGKAQGFAGAYTLGSADAASLEMRHYFGGGGPTPASKANVKTAENTGRIAKGIQKLNDRMSAAKSVSIMGIA